MHDNEAREEISIPTSQIQANDMNSRAILTRCVLVTLFPALLLPPFESAHGQWSVPDELRAEASVLNDEQIEFITSGAILNFIPERQLEHELASRDADSLRTFVDDRTAPASDNPTVPQSIADTGSPGSALPSLHPTSTACA